jgi:ATP-binding cassette subfamily G (WHITE) protein 2
LLKAGRIVYQGPTEGAAHYFEGLGHQLPPNENPADFFLDVITPDTTASAEALVEMDNLLQTGGFNSPSVNLDLGAGHPLKPRETIPWVHQFRVLFRRVLTEQLRSWPMMLAQLAQTVLMATLIGTAFLRIGTSETSIVRRQPVLFFCVVNQGIFGALIVVNSFPRERMLVLRERAAGTYYVSAYFVAKNCVEILLSTAYPIIFTITLYHLVGLHDTPSQFFIFMGFMILCSVAATSLALMVSALARTTDMSVTVLPLMLEISRLFGGFFLSPANLPNYFRFLDALSYVKYSYVGIALNELQGLHLWCSPAVPAAKCATTGEAKIRELGLDQYTVGECAGILVAYIVFCRTVAFLGVRFIKH